MGLKKTMKPINTWPPTKSRPKRAGHLLVYSFLPPTVTLAIYDTKTLADTRPVTASESAVGDRRHSSPLSTAFQIKSEQCRLCKLHCRLNLPTTFLELSIIISIHFLFNSFGLQSIIFLGYGFVLITGWENRSCVIVTMELVVLQLYKECLRRAKFVGHQQHNTALLVEMVRQQFKKHKHETDPDKIQKLKDDAARGLINHMLYESEKMSGRKFSKSA
ncbi:unnamed protein product [Linum trigynum]|uniref:Complex 1 LYR protein domain-containing protein n=1 Tax=Linum trigynum TaxID=586398 RepID=A0AAV2FGX3_9ROSI